MDCRMIIILLLILIATLSTAYDTKCPDPSRWPLHARVICSVEKNYICLLRFNSTANSSRYEEFCDKEQESEKGGKLVLRPSYDFVNCIQHRYQPFVFTTYGNSDCLYQKSKCNEVGQVVFNNGTPDNDTLCRCNHTNGYTFVQQPKNSCYCIPSAEDCSCYKTNSLPDFNCNETILNFTRSKYIDTKVFTELDNILDQGKKYRTTAAVGTLLGMICILCPICAWNVRRYLDKPRILLKQTSGIAFIGQTENVQIECKIESMKDILDVRWQKDNNNINLENGSKYCFKMEHDATLTIREVNLTDAGIYTCFVRNGIGSSQSNPFILTVKDLKDAEEIRHYIRVIIIGKEGVGKSSLMKRLLWKSPSEIKDIQSTDGIDISIAECEIDVEDGKWMPYNEATDDLVQRFERAFAKQQTGIESKNNDPSEILSDLDHPVKPHMALLRPNEPNQQLDEQPYPELKTEKEQNNASLSKIIPEEQLKNTKSLSNEFSVVDEKNESSSIINSSSDINEKEIDDAATALINSVKTKHTTMHTSSKRTASCWLWDFAGQKDFYATHQAFLSSCAVYLLVADITDDISKQHNMSEDFQHAGDYVDFWLNSIHCYCSVRRDNLLDPPVIVVCSKDDKLKSEKQKDRPQEKETNRQKFIKKIQDRFLNEPTKGHIRRIISISNVDDTDDVFDGLRKEIFKQASQMKDWGRKMPLKWLFLERILQKMKVKKVNVTTYEKLEKIARNKNIGITQKNELEDFLKTQHNVGNIIYFPYDNLKDYIIVNPKWLVQAFRCLISDKIDEKIMVIPDWGELVNTGKMTDTLFGELLKKYSNYDFQENKSHLIEVMKQYDILVPLRNEGRSDNLYMPCIVKAGNLEKILEKLGNTKTSWLCFKFDFLPSSFFNHVVVLFTEVWNESKEELAMYRQFAVLDLDNDKDEKIVLCVSGNIIGFQICLRKPVLQMSSNAPLLRTMVDDFIKTLKKKYGMVTNHTMLVKCNSATFATEMWNCSNSSSPEERKKLYYCSHHKEEHQVGKILTPWYSDNVKEESTSQARNEEEACTSQESNEASTSQESNEASTSQERNEASTSQESNEASTSQESNEASTSQESNEASTSQESNQELEEEHVRIRQHVRKRQEEERRIQELMRQIRQQQEEILMRQQQELMPIRKNKHK